MTHQRRIVSSLAASLFTVAVVTALGCGGDTPSGTVDMATGTGNTLTLTNVPTSCPATETAADLYTTVVQNTCAINGCHGQGGTSFQLTAAGDMHTKWVGVKSALYSSVSFPYVTANDLNNSWLMYKITGSQGKFGAQMPETGVPLTTDQLCKFVAWIKSGAQ